MQIMGKLGKPSSGLLLRNEGCSANSLCLKGNVQFRANAAWTESQGLSSLAAQEKPVGEGGGGGRLSLVWNSTTICRGSCSSQQQERILQHFLGSFLSSPAADIPCLHRLLPAEFPLGAEDPAAHVSHFTLAGTEQQELQKLQVPKKRAADSLGVFLGTRILMEISPAPKFCAHTIKIAIKALQVHQFVWVTEEPEQQIQPQHLP